MDDLQYKLATEDQLRMYIISFAADHNDLSMLKKLRAREIPELYYKAHYSSCTCPDFDIHYDKNMVSHIAKSSDKVLDYKNNEEISSEIDADIRIVNEEGEEVYKETKTVFETDFDYYTNQVTGEQYLAELRIPAADIISGKSSNETVFLTVYKNDIVRFDEVNCSALYCLPISDVELIFDTFLLSIVGNCETNVKLDSQ